MSAHQASIRWERAPHTTESDTYSRNHLALMNGGQQLQVSSSVEFKGDPDCADPEQLVISALASCHMLFFLAMADLRGFPVAHYEDQATAVLEKNAEGRMALTHFQLNPAVRFVDAAPDQTAFEKLHERAHHSCFIANSLTAQVTVLPRIVQA